jgi:hypothetical protein
MREGLNEPVSVVFYYNAKSRHMQPHMLTWQNETYKLGKVDFWHKTKTGDKIIHHFSITDVESKIYFKLQLDSDTLCWSLSEYMNSTEMKVHYDSWQGA